MKLKNIIFILLLSTFNFGENIGIVLGDIPPRGSKFFCISIPKSGTWLLEKLMRLMTNKKQAIWRLKKEKLLRKLRISNAIQLFDPPINLLNKCLDSQFRDEFLISHLAYNLKYSTLLQKKGYKKIFILRDPRDQLVSRIFYIQKHLNRLFPGLKGISFDELLFRFIGANALANQHFTDLLYSHREQLTPPKHPAISHIAKFYDAYLPWAKSKNCYTVKFEDLIGPNGGGSTKNQLIQVKNIANFLNINLTHDQVTFIIENLFGDTPTFREGKIGYWKKYFKSEHKKAFKIVAGKLLINLGYEKDLNW